MAPTGCSTDVGEQTAIGWCDHTFNGWIGCERKSPGCRFCYAEQRVAPRMRVKWGKHGERRVTSDNYWRQPLLWDRKAAKAGERRRVFCSSLADVFEDHPALPEVRKRLWALIEQTPNLDWLLLTKRPENIMEMVPGEWIERQPEGWDGPVIDNPWPANVWIGTSVEDQTRADERLPILLAIPAPVRFVSVEPLIAPVTLQGYLDPNACCPSCSLLSSHPAFCRCGCHENIIDWVIIGGETGHGARPMHPRWVDSLVDEIVDAGTKFCDDCEDRITRHWLTGEYVHLMSYSTANHGYDHRPRLNDRGYDRPAVFFKQWGDYTASIPPLALLNEDAEPDVWLRDDGRIGDAAEAMEGGSGWIGMWHLGAKVTGAKYTGHYWQEFPTAHLHLHEDPEETLF